MGGAAADAWRGPGHGSGDPSHHHQYMSVGSGGYPSGGYTPGYSQGGYSQGYSQPGGYPQGYTQGYTQGYGGSSPGWTPWPQVSGRSVRTGPCELDCKDVFITFIIITTFMHSLGSSGKVGNLLVNYR